MSKKNQNLFFLNYLKSEKIKLDNEEFIFQLETHPEYPSLISYHDTLNFFNVPNITVKISNKDVTDLPKYFIAEIQSRLSFVKKENNQFKVEDGFTKSKDIPLKEFQETWSGVVFAAESPNITIKIRKANNNLLIGLLCFFTILFIGTFSFSLSIFSLFIFCGFFLSFEAIKQSLNIESSFSNKVCNITKETDCNKVINSNSFKIFNYLGLSDISIIFFSGQLLSLICLLLLNVDNDFYVYTCWVLGVSSIICLFSIFYQWLVVKKWCAICLGIIAVLLAETLFSFYQISSFDFLNPSIKSKQIFLFLSSYLVSLMLWFVVKPILTTYYELKSNNKNLYKFKRNYNLFKNTLLKEKSLKIKNLQSEVFIGNPNSKFQITIVTNPLCKFCEKTHTVIEDLVKKYKDKLKINILFNINPKSDDLSNNKILKLHLKLLETFFKEGEEQFLKAFGNWFQTKDYDLWFNRYGKDIKDKEDYLKILETQYFQNKNNDIRFTPSVFIAGFSFPQIYDKEDILFFIEDLLEEEVLLNLN